MTKDFIRAHLSYRFVVYPDGTEALAAERTLRAGRSSAGRPYLNPLQSPQGSNLSRRFADHCGS
jgi:hypothetical protein